MTDYPPSWRVSRALGRPADAPPAAVVTPLGTRRIADRARAGMRAVIACTDATRACPDALLVGTLLAELRAAGVRDDDISILIATGLHRPSTPQERLERLGAAIVARYRIEDHDARDATQLVDLGVIDGIPLVTNRRCVDADILLATGVVEPHQYAGYSGGAKTVVIGCGGEATIAATHGTAMLDRPGTRLGRIDGNPFQAFVRAAGARIGLFAVANALLADDGAPLALYLGAPDEVHDALVALGRAQYEVTVARPAQLALAGVAAPKAANLYQASRAVTYLALADGTPLLPGAPIVLTAAIPEGAGAGAGEQRFFAMLAGAESPAALLDHMRRAGFPAGAQRAWMLAQVLCRHPVIVVGATDPAVVTACHMLAATDNDAAWALADQLARERFGLAPQTPLDVLDVPHALLTLPRLA
jgi:nickel-dependent lactate racemase